MASGRWVRIVLVILGIWLVVGLIALWLFFTGDTEPGSGEGEPAIGLTTP